jgi:diguanylate cyclase (GGDEF)-like protein/PAS domain S-box-containing protein
MTVPELLRVLPLRRRGLFGFLKQRRRLLSDAQTLAGIGYYEWLPHQQRAICSDELCHILGQPIGFSPSREEWLATIHPDDREDFQRQINAARGAGQSTTAYRIVRPDGEVRHLVGRRYVSAAPDGRTKALFGTIQDVTERRTAEEAGREAQELFETAFSQAPIGMGMVSLDGRWLRVNPAMCEIIGWPEEALLGRTFQDVTHPDDVPAGVQRLRELLDGAISRFQADKRYVSRDGREIWANLSVSLVRDAAGRPRHFIGQVQDISERKRYELALQEERLALDEAQRIAQIGSWSWDTRSGEVTWSAQLYRLFGRNPEAGPAVDRELLRYVHPADLDRARLEYAEQLAQGAPFELDFRIVRPDGTVRTLRGIGKLDPARPHIYHGTVQDVTDLRSAEFEARKERDYAAAITRSMLDGFLLTRNATILEVNQAMCDLTGFERDELLGVQVPFPFWPPESIEEIKQHGRRIARGENAEFETMFMRRDGTRFPVSAHTVPAESPDGVRFGLVTTIRDISERKRHEAELERLATQDPLTGLANHRVFHERLRAEFARALRQDLQLSVAVLDLDHFKQVNDRHGHPVGDQVLREAGERLRQVVREGEILARVGGEEFAWILTGMGEDGAYAAVERARQVIGETPFSEAGTVTMSAGVAELVSPDAVDDLYSRADQALYRAKQSGRNRTVRHGSTEPDSLALIVA